jgi:predicted nucleic acid-binding protein
VDAFDSDVLIYVARFDPLGDEAARLINATEAKGTCIGSVVLLSEVFGLSASRFELVEHQQLIEILSALDLKDVDYETAGLAAEMRAKYRLMTPDAIHLATAVLWGAERFHTNNSKDFGQHIDEIEIVLPA